MTLEEIRSALVYQFKSDDELIKAILELSQNFTSHRDKIGKYLESERLVSAYAAFYLITNYFKYTQVLKWLPIDFVEQLGACDLVDVGAGPGTYSLAWKSYHKSSQSVFQIEKSSKMREQAKIIWNQFYNDSLFQGPDWKWQSAFPKFLLFGHSANEMGAESVLEYVKKIEPEHILFIEPGTKEFFQDFLHLRKSLVNSGYHILFPCPLPSACPLESSQTDWCHQFIQLNLDSQMQRLCQMTRLDRSRLPVSVLCLSKTYSLHSSQKRLIRVLPETKHSFEWQICDQNQLDHYQIPKENILKTK